MKVFAATVASDGEYELGEGPVWDGPRDRVLWVDINAGAVHAGHLEGGLITPDRHLQFDETVGAVVCSPRRGAPRRRRPTASTASTIARAVPCTPSRSRMPRTAGSTTAPATPPGASWSAAWRWTPAAARSACTGSRTTGRSPSSTTTSRSPTGLPGLPTARSCTAWTRSLAWCGRGPTIRPAARAARAARSSAWTAAAGPTACASTPTATCGWRSGAAGEVRCYTPAGERLATVSVPAPHTTSVAFVGPDRDLLLITTATDQLSAAQLNEYPLSGRLFTAHVGAVGLPATPWSGR